MKECWHLGKAAEYAILHDTLPTTAPYTSLLLNGISHDDTKTIKNYTTTECDELYDRLKQERYNCIRDTAQFKQIVEKISPYLTE